MCMFLTKLSRRLHEGGMRARNLLVGPVLTVQHFAARLAFTGDGGGSVMVRGGISLDSGPWVPYTLLSYIFFVAVSKFMQVGSACDFNLLLKCLVWF